MTGIIITAIICASISATLIALAVIGCKYNNKIRSDILGTEYKNAESRGNAHK